MKTALLLIPKIDKEINGQAYLSACIKKVMNEGFILLTPGLFNLYCEQVNSEFIERLIPVTDSIFCFTDFGIIDSMKDIAEKHSEAKLKISFRQFTPEELSCFYAVSLENILLDISNREHMPIELLKSSDRRRELCEARQLYCKRARAITGMSLAQIGKHINRDHTTVMNGITQVDNIRELRERYNLYFNQ
jgi:hypothetical protein